MMLCSVLLRSMAMMIVVDSTTFVCIGNSTSIVVVQVGTTMFAASKGSIGSTKIVKETGGVAHVDAAGVDKVA